MKIFRIVILCAVLFAAYVCAAEELDFSEKKNWVEYNSDDSKTVDVFFICQSVDMQDEIDNTDIYDSRVRERFQNALNMEVDVFRAKCSVYSPYYRQMTLPMDAEHITDSALSCAVAYADVRKAFMYYLENTPSNRPLIIAGFSQGSQMGLMLMKEFFADEETQNRLVAAYLIGWKITESDLENYPHLKMAQGEDDIGVIISYNTEDEDVTESFVVGADEFSYSINPLNWETDSTPADKSENQGACFVNSSGKIVKTINHFTGAYIDPERGTLKVTDVSASKYTSAYYPEGVFHSYDYQFFYKNIQQNVAVRVMKFIGRAASGN